MAAQEKGYYAFISYKRGGVDGDVANWIHQKLEKYPYPQKLVTEENRPEDEKYIRRVFLDVKELHVSNTTFSEEIKQALRNSRYLLVICSKRAVESEYVDNEVAYFLETHNNDLSKILPVFIDSVEDSLPKSIRNTDMLSRHCPVYNSYADSKNEVNLYCFYHIVAFLLKVDFQLIYDRYKRYTKKKRAAKQRVKSILYLMSILIVVSLVYSVFSQKKLIERQEEIVELEKEIFPYSVVTGYVNNFLSPVVEYIKENEPQAHIFVHMPTKKTDIDNSHRDRFDEISKYITKGLSLDSISQVKLKTRMPRGSNVHKLYSVSNEKLNNKYLDFATTTSTFLAIAEKKKEKEVYKNENVDDMILEYTETFIKQANEILKEDSVYVTFISSISELKNIDK